MLPASRRMPHRLATWPFPFFVWRLFFFLGVPGPPFAFPPVALPRSLALARSSALVARSLARSWFVAWGSRLGRGLGLRPLETAKHVFSLQM